jgi:hypothetical protein
LGRRSGGFPSFIHLPEFCEEGEVMNGLQQTVVCIGFIIAVVLVVKIVAASSRWIRVKVNALGSGVEIESKPPDKKPR